MLEAMASNAVLAKARAMYGRRLTREDFQALLECSSVGEVAGYLKNKTDYASALSAISESSVHRGQLETKLKQKIFEDYERLCRYELSIGDKLGDYLIIRSEIEQILRSLILLQAGTPEEYLFALPSYLQKHVQINLGRLSQIHSYEELLEALDHTPYREILEPFTPRDGKPLDYTSLENALFSFFYKRVFAAIGRYSRLGTRKRLEAIFQSDIDMENFNRILRLRAMPGNNKDFIRSTLLPLGGLSQKTLDRLLNADTPEKATEIMKRTKSGKILRRISYNRSDQIPGRTTYQNCSHDIRFSTHPPVVMLSYLFLLRIEVHDIITVVEGIRYRLTPDEIRSLLVGVYQL